MESVSAVRLKKGLSTIKKDITSKVGAVWKLSKGQVIQKIRNLNYTYNPQNQELTTNSMIRKKRRVKL
jgi:hypothetical protein|tara:strand:- start:747 stop:950 length:204 start_codon:yes stop_codon:yes gene_type:complete